MLGEQQGTFGRRTQKQLLQIKMSFWLRPAVSSSIPPCAVNQASLKMIAFFRRILRLSCLAVASQFQRRFHPCLVANGSGALAVYPWRDRTCTQRSPSPTCRSYGSPGCKRHKPQDCNSAAQNCRKTGRDPTRLRSYEQSRPRGRVVSAVFAYSPFQSDGNPAQK